MLVRTLEQPLLSSLFEQRPPSEEIIQLIHGVSSNLWLLALWPAAILSIGFKSVLMGWFFMATGRTRALIVSHVVYDSVQIVMAVVAIRAALS